MIWAWITVACVCGAGWLLALGNGVAIAEAERPSKTREDFRVNRLAASWVAIFWPWLAYYIVFKGHWRIGFRFRCPQYARAHMVCGVCGGRTLVAALEKDAGRIQCTCCGKDIHWPSGERITFPDVPGGEPEWLPPSDAERAWASATMPGKATGHTVAWRAWRIDMVDGGLVSFYNLSPWPAGRPLIAISEMGRPPAHGPGIYASKTCVFRAQTLELTSHAVGKVALWGDVVEHRTGYRARYAYPLELWTFSADDRLRDLVRERYGVPVYPGAPEPMHITHQEGSTTT